MQTGIAYKYVHAQTIRSRTICCCTLQVESVQVSIMERTRATNWCAYQAELEHAVRYA